MQSLTWKDLIVLSKDQLSECGGCAGNGMMGPQGIWDCITLCMLVQLTKAFKCMFERVQYQPLGPLL